KLFAKHYQTEEIIPMEYVNKIKESANFLEGLATVRQLSFGLLDMGWHAQNPSEISDLKIVQNQPFASTQMYPDVKDEARIPSSSHIFKGGYSAGCDTY